MDAVSIEAANPAVCGIGADQNHSLCGIGILVVIGFIALILKNKKKTKQNMIEEQTF